MLQELSTYRKIVIRDVSQGLVQLRGKPTCREAGRGLPSKPTGLTDRRFRPSPSDSIPALPAFPA
jgi:hypothetical protein